MLAISKTSGTRDGIKDVGLCDKGFAGNLERRGCVLTNREI